MHTRETCPTGGFSNAVTKLSKLLVILCRDLLYYCILITLYIIILGWDSINT